MKNIDSWINWCDVNDNNDKVVLSTSAYEIRPDMKYRDTMYLIDKKTGQLINSIEVPPVAPFENTVMRGSPNFSEDGEFWLQPAVTDEECFLMLLEKLYGSVSYLNLLK